MKHFEKWWKSEGQYVRAGGGDYEKSIAFAAWNHTAKNAPAWHDAPTVPGLWITTDGQSRPAHWLVCRVADAAHEASQSAKDERWYGPISPDTGSKS